MNPFFMRDRSIDRTHRVRRGELISLVSVVSVFVVVVVLGFLVWRRSSLDPVTTAQSTFTVVVPPPTVSEPMARARTPVPTSTTPEPSPAPSADESNPLEFIPDWPSDRPFGILFMGLDRRPGEYGGRTDALILVRVDPKNQAATAISVPRDVCIANCLTEPYRINTVWQNEGADVLRSKVASLLGVHVDYWVKLDFNGFRRLVDFFGGIDIDVTTRIYDPTFPNATDTGFEPFYVESGVNHFNGETTLRYVRTRYQDGGHERDARQLQVLSALVDQIISPKTLVESPMFLKELSNTFESNVPPDLVPSMAKLVMGIGSQRSILGSIRPEDGMVKPVIADNGAFVLQPNVPLIHAHAAELMRRGEDLPSPNAASVEFADRKHP